MRNVLLLTIVLVLTSFALAHPYEVNTNSDDNYYWSHDYYHSGDYKLNSKTTYYKNTYYKGYDYNTQEEYLEALYKIQHPWLDKSNSNNYQNRGKNNNYQTNREVIPIYKGYDRIFVDVYDYKLKYSKTMNKEYITRCYTQPPTENTIVYIRC